TVAFPPVEVKRLTGLAIDESEMERILKALGFVVAKSDPWLVSVPSFRPDIDGKADLVEEIARILGFDRLPAATLAPRGPVEMPKSTPAQDRRRNARRALAARGLLEAVTWSFMDKRHASLFMSENEIRARGLVLANPIASDLDAMRPSILPNLLKALQRNADRGRDGLALFEVAPQYAGAGPSDQAMMARGARRPAAIRHWQDVPGTDIFAAKADALAALEAAGAKIEQLQTSADAPNYYHPGRSGTLRFGPAKALAHFGELHPRVLKALDVDGPVYGFEVFLDQIPEPKKKGAKTKPALDALDLMPLTRDFAFVVDANVTAEALVKAVAAADRKLISKVALFDVYEGKGVPEGKKSLAVEVKIQPREKTLNDEEIEALSARILAQVGKATGGVLRS
ncbi:MAG: phenylalanine--tRNA ligase subunit beta, partial [Parvularculaceae bacterium]